MRRFAALAAVSVAVFCLLMNLDIISHARMNYEGGAQLLPAQPQPELTAFSRVLSAAAGVYRDKSKVAASAVQTELSKVVLVTAANHGYKNMLLNWATHAVHLGLDFVVLAMDRVIASELADGELRVFFVDALAGRNLTSSAQASWFDAAFHEVTSLKLELVKRVLDEGFDALFVDTDVVLLADPVPALLPAGGDFMFQPNWVDAKSIVRSCEKTVRAITV